MNDWFSQVKFYDRLSRVGASGGAVAQRQTRPPERPCHSVRRLRRGVPTDPRASKNARIFRVCGGGAVLAHASPRGMTNASCRAPSDRLPGRETGSMDRLKHYVRGSMVSVV